MIIRLITLLLLLGAGEMYAQKIVGSVKVIRDKLQGRNLDIFEGFEAKVLEYVNNYDWAKTGDETPLNVDIQFFLEKVVDAGENKRVYTTIYITNGKELQFLDNSCIFDVKKAFNLYHDDNVIDPFLSIINFYIYLIIGDELDTVGKFLGTPFFQKASGIAAQSKALITYNVSGWDDRQIKADQFLDIRYQPYREMKDFYYEGKYNFFDESDTEAGRKNVLKALDMIEKLLTQILTKNHTERFMQVHYYEICKIFETATDKRVFDRLIEIDPKNKDTYQKYKDGKL